MKKKLSLAVWHKVWEPALGMQHSWVPCRVFREIHESEEDNTESICYNSALRHSLDVKKGLCITCSRSTFKFSELLCFSIRFCQYIPRFPSERKTMELAKQWVELEFYSAHLRFDRFWKRAVKSQHL